MEELVLSGADVVKVGTYLCIYIHMYVRYVNRSIDQLGLRPHHARIFTHLIQVGIGPGSVCTTRKQTGVGYPQVRFLRSSIASQLLLPST